MGRCDSCRYWEAPTKPYDDYDHTEGTVERAAEWGYCRRTEMKDGLPKSVGTLAFATDGEQYAGILATLPDFGCVQFEAKG